MQRRFVCAVEGDDARITPVGIIFGRQLDPVLHKRVLRQPDIHSQREHAWNSGRLRRARGGRLGSRGRSHRWWHVWWRLWLYLRLRPDRLGRPFQERRVVLRRRTFIAAIALLFGILWLRR